MQELNALGEPDGGRYSLPPGEPSPFRSFWKPASYMIQC
jgi:hypothetical protein